MNSQLSQIVAQEHQAELVRAAERHRLATGARHTAVRAPAGGSSVRRRFRIALPLVVGHGSPPAEAPAASPPFRRAKLVEVRAPGRAEDCPS